MLYVICYHSAYGGRYRNSITQIKFHLDYLANHFSFVFPGESIKKSVCLTFDDAYFDFYHLVFPLLKEMGAKAVLGVPSAFIQDKSRLSVSARLSLLAPPDCSAIRKDAFCSWTELEEMQKSGFVYIASHGHTHQNLLSSNVDLTEEIIHSKQILQSKLSCPIDTFIYPMGKFSGAVHRQVRLQYKYAMRLGGALNYSWQNSSGLIYRLFGDDLKNHKGPVSKKYYPAQAMRLLFNMARSR